MKTMDADTAPPLPVVDHERDGGAEVEPMPTLKRSTRSDPETGVWHAHAPGTRDSPRPAAARSPRTRPRARALAGGMSPPAMLQQHHYHHSNHAALGGKQTHQQEQLRVERVQLPPPPHPALPLPPAQQAAQQPSPVFISAGGGAYAHYAPLSLQPHDGAQYAAHPQAHPHANNHPLQVAPSNLPYPIAFANQQASLFSYPHFVPPHQQAANSFQLSYEKYSYAPAVFPQSAPQVYAPEHALAAVDFDQCVQLAHQKYDAQDFQGALALLQKLHAMRPADIPILLLLGCTAYSLGLHDLSIAYNSSILKLDAEFAEAYSNLGTTYRALANAHAQADDTSKVLEYQALAERYYTHALAIRPQYWDASINLAGLYTVQNRHLDALAVYDAIERFIEAETTGKQEIDESWSSFKSDFDLYSQLKTAEMSRPAAVASKYPEHRRKDLYFSKANILFGTGDMRRAKVYYFRALVMLNVDVASALTVDAAVLPPPMVTPMHAQAALQQQNGVVSAFSSTASTILQTLAKIYQDGQSPSVAVALYYLSLSIMPTANTCNNIGILLAAQRLQESIAWYELGLSIDPNHVHLCTNLGSALKDGGLVNEGIQCYLRAIAVQPTFYIALANLANVYKDMSRIEEAIDLYSRALEVKPDFVEAFCNWVNSLLFVCRWENHDANFARIREIVADQLRDPRRPVPTVLPFHTFTYSSLDAWMVREISRRNAEKVATTVASSDWFPGFPARPLRFLVDRSLNPADLDRALNYPYPYRLPPPPAPRLKIGYVSSDFSNHPLAHLMQSVFGFHDRTRFEVFCYSLSPSDNSAYRAKIEAGSDAFVDVSAWATSAIVHRIVEDGIHVLVNLNGYTKGGRNEIFAARPAPVSMTFMGFAGTMGAGNVDDEQSELVDFDYSAIQETLGIASVTDDGADFDFFDDMAARWMDYLVADEIACSRKLVCGEPLERDEREGDHLYRGAITRDSDKNRVYTEGLIFMPDSFFANDHRQGFRESEDEYVERQASRAARQAVPPHADEASLSPAESLAWRKEQLRRLRMRREIFPWMREDTIVFANFNQLYKIDPRVFDTWLRILQRVPNSVLWLLRFPPPGEKYLRQRAAELVGEQVARRIVFTDVAAKHVHIHRGRVADIFLDTPECNAHTTAADILWSGTPLVTLPKYDFKMCSRVAASVAYATGTWADKDDATLTFTGELPLDDQPKIADRRLVGHWMVTRDYSEYEERAVLLATSVRWEWRGIAGAEPPLTPAAERAYVAHVFYPNEADPTHARVPAGLLVKLRRHLFLERDRMPLFDTLRWTRNVERGMEAAYARWSAAWQAQRLRNEMEVRIVRTRGFGVYAAGKAPKKWAREKSRCIRL